MIIHASWNWLCSVCIQIKASDCVWLALKCRHFAAITLIQQYYWTLLGSNIWDWRINATIYFIFSMKINYWNILLIYVYRYGQWWVVTCLFELSLIGLKTCIKSIILFHEENLFYYHYNIEQVVWKPCKIGDHFTKWRYILTPAVCLISCDLSDL